MRNTPDALVVGGGPAGAAAAITLLRAGISATVVDRARFPRDKCCGDGLTTGALRRLESLGFRPEAVASFHVCRDLCARSPSGRVVRIPLQRDTGLYAAVARRVDLDAALLDVARQAGAKVIEGDGVTAVQRDDATGAVVAVLESGKTLSARHIVACDGARSAVRRSLRNGAEHARALPGRSAWLAFRAYASGVEGDGAAHLWVLFERSLLPGYAWSFPFADGIVNLGVGLPRAPGTLGRVAHRSWTTLLENPFVESLLGQHAELDSAVRSWPIPTGVRRSDLSGLGGRVLFCGDAAGCADPFTGEGIAQALESGMAAGRAVAAAAAEGTDSPAGQPYVKEVMESLSAEHALSTAAQTLFRRPLGARAALAGTNSTDRIGRAVGRWLFEEIPRTVAFRPRTWRRSTFERPGAFADGQKRGLPASMWVPTPK